MTLSHMPDLTFAQVSDVLRREVPDITVRETKGPVNTLQAFESPLMGAVVQIKQKPDKGETIVRVGGFVPNLGVRLLLVLLAIFPLLILMLVAEATVAKRYAEVLEQAPELGGSGATRPLSSGPESPGAAS
jgi:hypothetical protein